MVNRIEQSLPKISFSDLIARLENLDTPDPDIAPYLIPVPSPSGGIEPAFEPNPALVTGLETGLEGGLIVNSLNSRYRKKRNKAYRKRIEDGWTGLRIVDEGDSWFQYPLRLLDIIDFLADDHAVYSLSGAGHTLDDMISQNEVLTTLSREKADVFLLSAGGNDLFQNGNIRNLIEPVVPGLPAKDLVGQRFDTFVEEIMTSYRKLLLRVHHAFPGMLILIHGYSAAYSRMDRWIGRPLKAAGIGNEEAHNRIVEVMLAKFNAAQIDLCKEAAFDGKLKHVDLRPLRGAPDNWFDEIHMGEPQNKAAAKLFAQIIKDNSGGLESGLMASNRDTSLLPVASHARDLLALDETLLMVELSDRLELIDRDPAMADLPSAPLMSLSGGLESGAPRRPSGLAIRLLSRWERELYDLICSDSEEDQELRNKLRDALGVDTQSLIMLVTGWLVSGPLGVSALLAGVLAAILVKRFGGATAEVVCDSWKQRLEVGSA